MENSNGPDLGIGIGNSNQRELRKYIAYVRHHHCGGDFWDDEYFWKIVESYFLPEVKKHTRLREEYAYSSDCDCISGSSSCDECGIWIQRLESYTDGRARHLGL